MFNTKKRNRNTRKRNKLNDLNQATTTKRKTRVGGLTDKIKRENFKQTNELTKQTEQSKKKERAELSKRS